MWPIPTLQNEFVSISFSQNVIVCSWLQKTKNGTAPLVLRAYKRYSLNNLELHDFVIFNPTVIATYITSFLNEHNLRDAFVTFCVDCSDAENFVKIPISTPRRADFGISEAPGIQWEYRYLYPHHDDQYVFYVYSVPRSLILQYELLAIKLQINLIAVTTQTVGLIDAYKNIFGKAFRKSQLAVDMIRNDNSVENLISVDSLRRMVSINNDIDVYKEKIFIAAACGYIVERK